MNAKYPIPFSVCTLIILIGSFIFSEHKSIWYLEVFPILIGFPILFFTYHTFRFTHLIYILLIIHFVILSVGGIYTYAEAPLGYWMQDYFGFERNNYDKIGHFAQGFVPALLAREILLRTSSLRAGKWLVFIVLSICLAISALYEIIEWWVAVLHEASAEDFLGTQGNVWDAQSDMFFALIGASVALLTLSKVQDKALASRDARADSQY
ncbi:MAG: DUF2238 domain-containing protein [Burkholderiales bacterium]|jgi:putative membrane protein|nr:DUF2238 domain-containing protein [Burkholderiales bacterium]